MFRNSRCCQCDFCGDWIGDGMENYIVTLTLTDKYHGTKKLKICPNCEEKVYDIYSKHQTDIAKRHSRAW